MRFHLDRAKDHLEDGLQAQEAGELGELVCNRFEKAEALAKHFWEQGRVLEAAHAYRRCGDLLRQYARYGSTIQIKKKRLRRSKQYTALAHRLEAGQSAAPADEVGASTDYEAGALGLINRSTTTWEDICGLEEAKGQIRFACGLAGHLEGVRLGSTCILLLYGPPGTGKTLLAAAASNELGATFFHAHSGDLLSNWFGESTRLIDALFRAAEDKAPSVILLDEFDDLAPAREGSESVAEKRITSILFSQLDRLGEKGDAAPHVVAICETCFPWLLDAAVPRHLRGGLIHVRLPDSAARRAIFSLHLDKSGLQTRVSLERLAGQTEGYSGREIAAICQQAIEQMLERVNPELFDIAEQDGEELSRYELKVAPLTRADFDKALERIEPHATPAYMARLSAWAASQE